MMSSRNVPLERTQPTRQNVQKIMIPFSHNVPFIHMQPPCHLRNVPLKCAQPPCQIFIPIRIRTRSSSALSPSFPSTGGAVGYGGEAGYGGAVEYGGEAGYGGTVRDGGAVGYGGRWNTAG